MGDLKNPRLIYLKGWLFLLIAVASCGLILYEFRNYRLWLLVGIAVWASARFYYFAFYVIEHYVDPQYKFAGLWDFGMYILRRKQTEPIQEPETTNQTNDTNPQEGGGSADRL